VLQQNSRVHRSCSQRVVSAANLGEPIPSTQIPAMQDFNVNPNIENTNLVGRQEDDELPREDSMAFAVHDSDDDERQIETPCVNNEDVPFEDELPDDINVDEMVRISQIQDDFHDINIPIFKDIELSYTFKVGDLFQTKDILLQTLRTWSIKRCVTYKTKKKQ